MVSVSESVCAVMVVLENGKNVALLTYLFPSGYEASLKLFRFQSTRHSVFVIQDEFLVIGNVNVSSVMSSHGLGVGVAVGSTVGRGVALGIGVLSGGGVAVGGMVGVGTGVDGAGVEVGTGVVSVDDSNEATLNVSALTLFVSPVTRFLSAVIALSSAVMRRTASWSSVLSGAGVAVGTAVDCGVAVGSTVGTGVTVGSIVGVGTAVARNDQYHNPLM